MPPDSAQPEFRLAAAPEDAAAIHRTQISMRMEHPSRSLVGELRRGQGGGGVGCTNGPLSVSALLVVVLLAGMELGRFGTPPISAKVFELKDLVVKYSGVRT